MSSCGRLNVRKQREIKDSDKYTDLDIYLKLNCLYKSEVTYSESRYYMGRLGKGVNTSMALRKKDQIINRRQGFLLMTLLISISVSY